MKNMNILLLGAHINSSNLGCQALTYSLILMLEKVSLRKGIKIHYYIFEYQPNQEKTEAFIKKMSINEDRLLSFRFPYCDSLKSEIRNLKSLLTLNKILKKVDFAIDITAGDSFADIYGDSRFLATTKVKETIEKKGIPLILGPQTYGPFEKKKNELYASRIIKNAYKVISRDKYSSEYVKKITGRDVLVTTDLAFQLPYEKNKKCIDRFSIGINISGLLVGNASEKGFVKKNQLNTNYDHYIDYLLKTMTGEDECNCKIFLIPHVDEDYDACEYFNKKYPNTTLVKPFENPMDVKRFISNMDVFIGARMHATIAAFTSGVVTIPTAYSRKFETMFSVVNYNTIIDLQSLETMEAIERTLEYIKNYRNIRKQVEESLKIANSYSRITEEFFSNAIEEIMENKYE